MKRISAHVCYICIQDTRILETVTHSQSYPPVEAIIESSAEPQFERRRSGVLSDWKTGPLACRDQV